MKSRTFLLTLILFLFFFNSGILIVSTITLKNNLAGFKDQSLREHYFIVSSFVKDVKALEERGIPHEDAVESLYKSYDHFYSEQKVIITIALDGKQLFSDVNHHTFKPSETSRLMKSNERHVLTKKIDGKEHIIVEGALPSPYDRYTFTYYYDISTMLHSWQTMTMKLLIAGMCLGGLLAICLFFVLNRIFKPLQEISTVSRRIAQGEYNNRITIKGKDELAEMAASFNHMAEEIQNKIQQITEASKQKQQFIDNLAHELRTPLTSIYGYADYIQKVVRTEEDKLFATNLIMSESRRLQNIANRLLYMATSRENVIERENIQIKELICGVKQSLSMKANEKGIELIDECKFDTLFCEADMIHVLLVNLIDNAMKACEKNGMIKVSARIENEKKVISVQDNGKGMTAEQLNHITEPFYRIDTSRTRSIGGAGLGLALCKEIAENHEAELKFISKEGEGTTVKIIFTTP
ncbi:sensor histidine kinase [Pseudogracilibacillus sp. SO30301A]|uniref:sensor histidine kinase n=1 Tax=Pseudogracilibacillus sp. SO30301A TaxID=3098291 RepID=UPI00300E534F